ncbi:hypothetical protein TRICI_004322 [Trichomonascus ciferrii]|uniref:Uncharacterized protein n=1 Tax=Trichomonascus ciferrii TaxID=44093 RepID=A0A642V0J9_9ASCO|nr:hypothetical protein TRICI_004322 [Trichomonascus ciferrii]
METNTAPTSTPAPRGLRRNERQRKDDVSNLLSQMTDTASKSIAEKLGQSKIAIENQAAYQSRQLGLEEKPRTQKQEEIELRKMELEEYVKFKSKELNIRERLTNSQVSEAEVRMKQIQAQLDILEEQKANISKIQESVMNRMNVLINEGGHSIPELKQLTEVLALLRK